MNTHGLFVVLFHIALISIFILVPFQNDNVSDFYSQQLKIQLTLLPFHGFALCNVYVSLSACLISFALRKRV